MYYQENACIYPDLSPKNMTGVKKKKKEPQKGCMLLPERRGSLLMSGAWQPY
jgi:hypothetical protein